MKSILGILFVFMLVVVAFQMCGCGVVSSSTILTSAEIANEIAHQVDDIHRSGADQKVLDDVHKALSKAHAIISEHHEKHVGKQQ